jgi:hypothetical protein
MTPPKDCFDANREWAARVRERDPGFFDRLRHQQHPELFWIGCSDSRLPPGRIIGKQPGEVFVYGNVGNVVVHTDSRPGPSRVPNALIDGPVLEYLWWEARSVMTSVLPQEDEPVGEADHKRATCDVAEGHRK